MIRIALKMLDARDEAGKRADMIAVSGDPLKNIKDVENVNFVMKGGIVQRNNIH